MTSGEERNADLERRADLVSRARRRYLVVCAVIIVGAPIAVALGLAAGSRDRLHSPAALAVVALPVAIVAVMLLVGWRMLGRRMATAPTGALDPAINRAVSRALRAGEPIAPEQRVVAAYIARRTASQRWAARLILLGAALITCSGLLVRGPLGYLIAGYGVLNVAVAVSGLVAARRIRRTAAAQGLEPDANGRPVAFRAD